MNQCIFARRTYSHQIGRIALVCGVALSLCSRATSFAGVIRDDRLQSDYLNLGALPAYASVGMIQERTASGGYVGSGTLISSNWVLTAAHMVDKATSMNFTVGGTRYTADKWVANPSWTGNLGAGYDIGLIHLSKTVGNVTPATRYTGTSELGKTATFTGFGMTGTGLTGATTFDGRKRAGQNVVDWLYGGNSKTARLFLVDFDDPHSAIYNHTGSSTPLGLEYLIAPGDSGGGDFIDFGKGSQLVGVNSFGMSYTGTPNSSYGNLSGHVRVSAFNSWIDSVIGTSAKASLLSDPSSLTSQNLAQLPEPSSFVLAVLAALGMGIAVRRQRKPLHIHG